jgi:hypothetical protein
MPGTSIKLPVLNLLPGGIVSDHPFNGEPCINVGVSFQKAKATHRGSLLENITQIFALIDTGAQWNLVDEELVKQNNSPILETLTNQSAVGSATITNHALSLMLYGAGGVNLLHETGAGTIDLRGRHVPYRMILGRKFLQATRFNYDSIRGITEMEVLGGQIPGVL